jgi:hypothetical protein
MKRLAIACVAVATLYLSVDITVFAQAATTLASPAQDGPLGVPTVVQTPEWLNYVALIAVGVTMALVGWGIAIFNKKAGLENNATAMQIEAHARDLLQTALTNLAGRVIVQLGPKLNDSALSIQNATIRAAVQALPNLANDAIKLFPTLRDPNVVAQKIIDKIGVLTASNPAVNPTQASTSTPPRA